jgi:hypothetical protein
VGRRRVASPAAAIRFNADEMTRLRRPVLLLGLLGALLLVVAEWTDLYRITSRGDVVAADTAGEHHAYALLVIGVAAAVVTWLATRPGAVRFVGLALLLLGVAALFVVVAIDLPDLGQDGAFGEVTRPARSSAAVGFFLETAGAVLVLAAGGLATAGPRG